MRSHLVCFVVLAVVLPTRAPAATDVPSNGWVVWASDRKDGRREIYLMKADGTGVTRLTYKGGEFPAWSPDSSWIAYRDLNTSTATRVIRHDGTGDKKVCDGEFRFWMHDKTGLVCGDGTYYLVNPDTGSKKVLFKKSDFSKLSGTTKFSPGGITHDGRYLLAFSSRYKGGYKGDNGTFNSGNSAVILDFQDKSKIYFFGSGCEPTSPPKGDLIYHICGSGGGCANYPDPFKMSIKDIASRSSYKYELTHKDSDWGHEYFPRISNDNVWMVYGATTGCHDHSTCDYEIFVHRLGAGSSNRTRITNDKGNDSWPSIYVGTLWKPPTPKLALSPTSLAFTAQQGASNPASKSVTVSNGGPGTLKTVQTGITYGSGSGWLTVKASGSGNSQTLTNTADITGLSANTYTATVKVTEASASNSPQSYTVSLTVTAKPNPGKDPAIALSPTSLSFNTQADGGDPTAKNVTVTNGGGKTLGSVKPTIKYLKGSGWLTTTTSGSGNSQSIANAVAITGLSPDTYSATVEVAESSATNSPQNYSVSLTVTAAPTGDGGVTPDGGVADASSTADGPTIGDSGGYRAREAMTLEGGCSLSGEGSGGAWILVLLLLVIRRKSLNIGQ